MAFKSITKRAAEIAVQNTGCTYSVAREIAEEMANFADADGIAYDEEVLAEVVADRLVDEGWVVSEGWLA